MNRALTGEEIKQLLGGHIKVLRYRDVDDYNTLDELLAPYGKVAILIESKPGFGHWVLVQKLKGKRVEMFDSYGLCVDDELDYIDPEFRRQSNQLKRHLTELMVQRKYQIHYNDHPLQALKQGVSTCGRWVTLRAANADMNIDAFARKVRREAKQAKMTPDELVCKLVALS